MDSKSSDVDKLVQQFSSDKFDIEKKFNDLDR